MNNYFFFSIYVTLILTIYKSLDKISLPDLCNIVSEYCYSSISIFPCQVNKNNSIALLAHTDGGFEIESIGQTINFKNNPTWAISLGREIQDIVYISEWGKNKGIYFGIILKDRTDANQYNWTQYNKLVSIYLPLKCKECVYVYSNEWIKHLP